MPSPEYPFHNLKDFHVVMSSMSASYAGRRLLLTTAGTWNLLLPLVAVSMAARRWTGRELAFAGALAVTMIQLVFATDNERVVAAGYPFVLAWCALQLDTMDEQRRRWAGAAIVLAQLPWLLEIGECGRRRCRIHPTFRQSATSGSRCPSQRGGGDRAGAARAGQFHGTVEDRPDEAACG